MYFVEIQRALAEIRRVLKPGGQVGFTVWGPPDQGTYMARMMTPFFKRIAVPPPPPDAPQPFRFAVPGSLAAELERAGFRNVREELKIADTAWPGPPKEAWQMFYDVAVPLQPVFDGLPEDERQQAVDEVIAGLREGYDGTQTHAEVALIAVSATC
jgi:SAM-dependent methyltransferase